MNSMTSVGPRDWRIDPERLWRRYIIALMVLLGFVLASHLSARHTVETAAFDAHVINDAGRQRMLGQRVLALSARVAGDGDTVERRVELGILAENLEASHRSLSAMGNEHALLYPAYFEGPEGDSLDTMLTQYVADARIIARGNGPAATAALARLRAIGSGGLLGLQDAAVHHHEMQARHRAGTMSAIHRGFLLAALTTLLVQLLLIFRPAERATRSTLAALEKKSGALETARNEVSRRNRQLAALRDIAAHDALHDPLTGLANRRQFRSELTRRCTADSLDGSDFALLKVDLDRFKELNDVFGHAAGDRVLHHVADVLRRCLNNEGDFLARVSGDSFVVLTGGGEDRDTLTAAVSCLMEELAKVTDPEGTPCSFSASIGIAFASDCSIATGIDAELLVSNAGIALFNARSKGRNRCEFFTETMREEMEASKGLGDDLIRAIERNEFFPVYQVQVSAGARAVHGVEALARWRHPEKGEIAPWRFLPVAASLGLTEKIDDAILRQSLADFAAWKAAGLTVPNLSVNVSARRLADPDLIPSLREMAIPAGQVSFEVLESVFADRMDDTLRFTLDALDDMGIAIEVDDFGTGHASLLSLLSLRPERLKIARELIDPAPTSPEHRAILESIMQIARTLDTDVVAEGVETEAHAQVVEQVGVHQMQGFYFCRPIPADEAALRIADITATARDMRAA